MGISHSTFFLFNAQFLFCLAFHFTLLQSLFRNLSTFDKVVYPKLNLCSAEMSRASKHQLRMMQILNF